MTIADLYSLINRAVEHARLNIDRLNDVLDRDHMRDHCSSMKALATKLAHTAIQQGNVSADTRLLTQVRADVARVTKAFGPLPT